MIYIYVIYEHSTGPVKPRVWLRRSSDAITISLSSRHIVFPCCGWDGMVYSLVIHVVVSNTKLTLQDNSCGCYDNFTTDGQFCWWQLYHMPQYIYTLFVITFEKSDDLLAFSCLQALSLGHSQYAHVKHFLQMMHPDLCQTTCNYPSFNSLLVLLTGQIGLPMFPLHLLWDYIYLSLYGKNTD